MKRSARAQAGYTYLSLLFFVALAGVGLAHFGMLWHMETQRDREKELMFVGDQFRRAIATYYEESPEGKKQYPATLEDLLEDNRTVNGRRHLRRIYTDPFTGDDQWGLIKTPGGDRIMGVYSLSQAAPVKAAGFAERYAAFGTARHHSDWKFVHAPLQPVAAGPVVAAPQPPPTVDGGPSPVTPVADRSPAPDAGGGVTQPVQPPRPKSRCERIAESDMQTCQRLGQRFDANTEADCVRTARDRAVACEQGRTMPSLYIRYY